MNIIGVGQTKFKVHWDRDASSLATLAIRRAIEDCGISPEQIESMTIGTMSSGLFSYQEHYSSLIPDFAGLKNIAATRVEAACASGGLALKHAANEIKAGNCDIAVALGVEKMNDLGGMAATRTLAAAAHTEWEALQGATFPALYAMIAKLHMHKYGTTREQLALCSVKSHENGLNNPYAQFRKRITVKDVLESSPVADPLNLLDCSPVTDGAAAVILASDRIAHKFDTPVKIAGIGHATDSISLHDRDDITTFKSTVLAAKQALKNAKLDLSEIGCAEVHDCFSIAEILALEDIGFCDKGKGGIFTEEGNTALGGRIPVNPSGGLKSKGHPVGATGIAQAIEAVLQLRNEAKNCTNAEAVMTHNIGGSGGTAVCHILRRCPY